MNTAHSLTLAAEVAAYADLQREMHDALRAQHPEWVRSNGDSPICDAYESRFAELLRILVPVDDKKCVEIRNFRGASLALVTENSSNRYASRACHNCTKYEHNA